MAKPLHRKAMLPDFAYSLFQRFEREGIPLLLAGGWAVSYQGYPRTTLDVDWVCSRTFQAKAEELMAALGFEKKPMAWLPDSCESTIFPSHLSI